MSLLSLLLGEKKKTANVAKERLQFILTHERTGIAGIGPVMTSSPLICRDFIY